MKRSNKANNNHKPSHVRPVKNIINRSVQLSDYCVESEAGPADSCRTLLSAARKIPAGYDLDH